MSLSEKYDCYKGLPLEYLFDEIQVSTQKQKIEVKSIIREELGLSTNRLPSFLPFELMEQIMEIINVQNRSTNRN